MALDSRAVTILLDRYWSPRGWTRDGSRNVAPEDFAYAKAQGVMFDPIRVDHAEVLARLAAAIAKLDCRRVADAFLVSLSSRRLDLRSALGSFAVFKHLPPHEPQDSVKYCDICRLFPSEAEDLNILNFERLKWGGVRHTDPVYAAMDLELFLKEAPQAPRQEDIQIFRAILSAIETTPPKETSAVLHKRFAKALKSNKGERDFIIAILGYCGVLETADHPGFCKHFIPFSQRRLPHGRFSDMPYPACWWTGDSGINKEALREYFGHVL